MKLKQIILTTFTLLLLASCEVTDLDLQEDINNLSVSQADANLLLNNIQLDFAGIYNGYSAPSRDIVRMENQFGQYPNIVDDVTLDGAGGEWAQSYQLFGNVALLQTIADQEDLPFHRGIGLVLQAYAYTMLVDYLDDVPFEQANNPLEFPFPELSNGETSIYPAIFGFLDDAISSLSIETQSIPNDLYYGGDRARWIALANTLRLKLFAQTRLVNPAESTAGINAIITSGNFISTVEGDFQFQYSTAGPPVDSRHPFFIGNYLPAGAGTYMSNSFMTLLKDSRAMQDPRLDYFIFRQTSLDPEGDFLPCDGNPAHDFCYIGDAYWGRDHTDDEGIPNDNGLRATYGLYPAGGAFDGRSITNITNAAIAAFEALTPEEQALTTEAEVVADALAEAFPAAVNSDNAGGAGIVPIFLSSFSNFLLAETALTIGTNGNPRALLEQAVRLSFQKTSGFLGSPTIEAARVEDYIQVLLSEYDSAADDAERLDIIMTEYYVAAFGNGVEPYNNYRRTGFPSSLQSPIFPSGDFPRSFRYPGVAIQNNSDNIPQRDLTDQVFWDTNPLGFID